MIKKKQLLIEILKELEWQRDLASWFLVIIEKTWNEELIDKLLKIIQKWIKTIKDNRIRTKLINRIKKLQSRWDKDQENSTDEANKILKNLETQ